MTRPPLVMINTPEGVQEAVDAMLLELPGKYFLAKIEDSDGRLRNRGSCALRPRGRSSVCDVLWFRETYGTVTAIDLHWNFISPTTVWPIWDAVWDGPKLLITGPRGSLWLTGNEPACGSCFSLDTCGSTSVCLAQAPPSRS